MLNADDQQTEIDLLKAELAKVLGKINSLTEEVKQLNNQFKNKFNSIQSIIDAEEKIELEKHITDVEKVIKENTDLVNEIADVTFVNPAQLTTIPFALEQDAQFKLVANDISNEDVYYEDGLIIISDNYQGTEFTFTVTKDKEVKTFLATKGNKGWTIEQQISDSDENSGTHYEGEEAAPYVSAENFNTHKGTDYQGINVGFKLESLNVSDLQGIEVSLYHNNEKLVTNEANEKLLALTDKQLSTSFFVTPGSYEEEYWTLGEYTWTKEKAPTKAVIKLTDKYGNTYTVVNENLSEATAKFEDLFPSAYEGEEAAPYVSAENFNTHKGTDYQGINVGFKLESLNVSDLQGIEVSLYLNNEKLVTNEANEKLLALTDKQLSTPFFVTPGSYEEEYWTLGEYKWTKEKAPTKAVIKLTDKYGNTYTVVNENLNEATAKFEDLFPYSFVGAMPSSSTLSIDGNFIISNGIVKFI